MSRTHLSPTDPRLVTNEGARGWIPLQPLLLLLADAAAHETVLSEIKVSLHLQTSDLNVECTHLLLGDAKVG